MNPKDVNKKIQKRLFEELDDMESKTTDKKILKSISNIRELFNEA